MIQKQDEQSEGVSCVVEEKSKWKKCLPYVILVIATFFFCWLFCLRRGIFGSKMDWISQHSVFPDYFRRQFYETGELFPQFAANLGGGQNIYNLAYYGLLSPLILPSYLLPFVKMADYLQAVQLLCLAVSVCLMYYWLKRQNYSRCICFWTALIFLLAGPMIFHSYTQIMFVNYMPFLCLGFIGVERYFEGRSTLLTVSIFLMIMTSFYYSIGGLIALGLYGMYRYVMLHEDAGQSIRPVAFFKDGFRFLWTMGIGVMMSSMLLIPTALTLMGRQGEGSGRNLWELLIPSVRPDGMFYRTYGIGLTAAAMIALLGMMFGRRASRRLLGWSCGAFLTVTLFTYLLNGGLYVRDKVLIPFLPLLCYILACYLDEEEKCMFRWTHLIPCVFSLVILWFALAKDVQKELAFLEMLDGVLTVICFAAAGKWKNPRYVMMPAVIFLLAAKFICTGALGYPVSREHYKELTDEAVDGLIEAVTETEKGFYRMEQQGTYEENQENQNRIRNMKQYLTSLYSSAYHAGYQRFCREEFLAEQPFRNVLMTGVSYNPVFLRFMGVKYIISRGPVPGYTLWKKSGDWNIYMNESVSPVAYATDLVVSEEEYKKLSFPYNETALLKRAVVEAKSENEKVFIEALKKKTVPVDFYFSEITDAKKGWFTAESSEYTIKTDGPSGAICTLSEAAGRDSVLFLKFRVKNLRKNKDAAIYVEGIKNKLTARSHIYYNNNTVFYYGVPLEEGQKEVEFTFGAGNYEISEIQCFIGTLPDKGNSGTADREAAGNDETCLYQSEFFPDMEQTKENRIAGHIDVKDPGYFITTIPFEESFEVLVDGKAVETQRVNLEFLGFEIGKGSHEVLIVYHAPGYMAGKLLSVLGIAMWLLFKHDRRIIIRS